MKAVRFEEPQGFEGIDGLEFEDAPDPRPAIGDAIVQVRAASFTPTELLWPLATDRNGHPRGRRVPAHEGSGVVVELGYGSAGVSVGDEVYGLIDGYRDGWAAEYVAIEVRSLAPKPETVDFVDAAAIPQAALTSWQALFDHGHLEPGQTVVIHGAGGGVGSTAVPLARWAGAHVIGTGRANARQRVLDLGAEQFVDVEQDGWQSAIGYTAPTSGRRIPSSTSCEIWRSCPPLASRTKPAARMSLGTVGVAALIVTRVPPGLTIAAERSSTSPPMMS